MGHSAPQCWAFSAFDFEHQFISNFCGTLKSFWDSFMPPCFVWALLIIEDFLSYPQCCLGTFIVEDFFMPLKIVWALLIIKDFCTCPPV